MKREKQQKSNPTEVPEGHEPNTDPVEIPHDELGLKPLSETGTNEICQASTNSQNISSHNWNAQLYDRWHTAYDYWIKGGWQGEEPPAPRQAILTWDFKTGAPYYRLEDKIAILTFCMNGKEVPLNKADDNWNYNQPTYPK